MAADYPQRIDMAAAIAAGAGLKRTRTIASAGELAEGGRMLREGNGTAFLVLKVKPDDPPPYKRNLDPAACRIRFAAPSSARGDDRARLA